MNLISPDPSRPRTVPVSLLRAARRPIAAAEAALAQHTVHLAPEPPGERFGVVTPDGATTPGADSQVNNTPLRFEAIGDSLVAGSGVDDQSEALVPRIARQVAAGTGRDVHWSTHARLGATMRRVRYRFLPEVDGADVVFVCAGSNDLMARRTLTEWEEDLNAVLDGAAAVAPHVVACSAGQLYKSPALRPTLRAVLREWTDVQTDASAAICEAHGVPYVDVAHCELVDDFWAADGFHPSAAGYAMAADMIAEAVITELAA